MDNHDLDRIQSDLDMQLLTQMQIERELQRKRGGPTPEEIQANRDAITTVRIWSLLGLIGFVIFLWLNGLLPEIWATFAGP